MSPNGIVCWGSVELNGFRASVIQAKRSAERASLVEMNEGVLLSLELGAALAREADTADLSSVSLERRKKKISVWTSLGS